MAALGALTGIARVGIVGSVKKKPIGLGGVVGFFVLSFYIVVVFQKAYHVII